MPLASKSASPATGWNPQYIKAEIWTRGSTLTAVAAKAGLPESACRVALNRPHEPGEKAISAFLGVPLHELWPDRYDEAGGRIHHVRDELTAERNEAHRLNAQAG